MSKICIFSRTSTTQQDVEQQTNVLIDKALHLGYSKENQVIVEYQESGQLLSIENRQGIKKLKECITNDGNIDTVICWELTRIARRADVIYNIRDFLLEHKIRWIILKPSYMELIDRDGKLTPTMSLVLGIFVSFTENETAIRAERFKRAKNTMRNNNQKFAGAVVFGYIKDEMKHCIPHPLHGKIIAELYDHYVNTDASLYETYKWAEGKWPEVFPYREYIRAGHKIGHLLRNELYSTGNWCYPPLVPREIYQRAIEKMNKSRCQARYKNTRELLCRGKIYCAECGHVMTPSGGNTKAYVCSTDKKHSCQISFDIGDWIMWEECRSLINLNAAIDSRQKIHELEDMIRMKINLIQQLELKIKENEQQMNKLLDVYMKGIIQIEQFEPKMEELKGVKMTLNNEMNEQRVTLEELRIALNENQNDIMKPTYVNVDLVNDFAARLEFVRKYISKMIIEKSKNEYRTFYITFEYTRPLMVIRSIYKYVCKNQNNKKVYRINEDGSEEPILG